jgi:hypothetical protein
MLSLLQIPLGMKRGEKEPFQPLFKKSCEKPAFQKDWVFNQFFQFSRILPEKERVKVRQQNSRRQSVEGFEGKGKWEGAHWQHMNLAILPQ